MRILVCGNRAEHEWPESCVRSLRRSGHDVRLTSYRWPSTSEIESYLPANLKEEVPVLARTLRGRQVLQELVFFNQCVDWRPDLILLAGIYNTWSPDALADVRESIDARVVLWAGDNPYQVGAPDIFACSPFYDEVWFANFRFAERAAGSFAKTGYLAFGCDPERDAPPEEPEEELAPYRCQVSFLGTLKNGREPFLDRLAREPWTTKVWGPRLEDDVVRRFPALTAAFQSEHVQGQGKRRVYGASEVVLNLHHTGFANMKLYEAASCGAFQISNKRDEARATSKVLPFCEDVVTFETYEELCELLAYWIPRPDEREAQARALQETMHAHHTWDHRLGVILAEHDKARGAIR